MVQPADSVKALSDCLLTLSKRLVSRTNSIWAARQQAAYFCALSTPEADPLTVRALHRRCFKPRSDATSPLSVFYALHVWVMFLGSIHCEKKQSLIPSASTPMLSDSSRGRTPWTTWPSLQDQGTSYTRTPPLSCSPTVRCFPTAR